MTGSRRSFRRRAAWLVPAATAAVVAGAVTIPLAAQARTPELPATTPEALLAAVGSAHVEALSGQVQETADLGLPALPDNAPGAATSWQSLLTGTHRITVALDGPEHQRLGLLGSLAETDVVHDGTDLWTYASGTGAVTHVVLPAPAAPTSTAVPGTPLSATPQEAAQRLLAAVSPTTQVTVGDPTTVAGQDAYTLILQPRQANSTIGRVVIAIDAARHLPLRVQVFAAGAAADAAPAFETGFTTISYDRPSADTFRFTPPAGSTVTTHTLPAKGMHPATGTPDAGAASVKPTVIGSGWAAVAELAPGSDALASLFGGTGTSSGDRSPSALLDQLFVRQSDGSRLFAAALVNALITPDGRILVGAVTPQTLSAAATK